MKAWISSAGLLYLYLSGYEENGMIYMQQVNTYNHIEEGFYQQTMALAEATDEDARFVHIFAVVGIKEKANKVVSIMETKMPGNTGFFGSNAGIV